MELIILKMIWFILKLGIFHYKITIKIDWDKTTYLKTNYKLIERQKKIQNKFHLAHSSKHLLLKFSMMTLWAWYHPNICSLLNHQDKLHTLIATTDNKVLLTKIIIIIKHKVLFCNESSMCAKVTYFDCWLLLLRANFNQLFRQIF